MSSSDIEDVLSSIRRLVTEDLRPRVATAPAAVEPAPPVSEGKLLLTPALRVVGPAEAPAARPPIDGVLSLIGARVAPPPAGFEAETGDEFDASAEKAPPRPVTVFAQPATAPVVAATPAGSNAPSNFAETETAFDPVPDSRIAEDDIPDSLPPVVDLDEDTLRDLIRDVLREELQGPMGERITRNIRKLVRAELARAVAVRNID